MRVFFSHTGTEFEVEPGTLVSDVCERAGMPLDLVCGGKGTCGKCLVDIEEGGTRKTVLGCQYRVEQDMTVFAGGSEKAHQLLESTEEPADFDPPVKAVIIAREALAAPLGGYDLDCLEQAILDQSGITVQPIEFELLSKLSVLVHNSKSPYVAAIVDGARIVDLVESDGTAELFGAAVDIGTTSVVAFLYNLVNGQLLGHCSSLNGQCRYGADVISRIEHAERDDDGLVLEQKAIHETVDTLVRTLCERYGVPASSIYEVVYCGNSTMQHLFLGVSPSPLGRSPFLGLVSKAVDMPARHAGILSNERATHKFMPLLGGFVGADTTACLLELPDDGRVRMMIDLGTNCEVAIGTSERILVASTACGPALEGAGLSMGMRAMEGAIEHVSFDSASNSFCIKTIGDVAPVGFCGSGIIDMVATLLEIGIINRKGAFIKGAKRDEHPLGSRIKEQETGRCFVLVDAEDHPDGLEISITLKDIRAIQLAKSAIYTGCTLIVETFGIKPEDIEEICLAGAFGNYIGIPEAQSIGLLPNVDGVPIRSIGNGAGLGAQRYLLSTSVRNRAEAIRRNTTHLELASNENFTDVYMRGMAFEEYALS